MRVGSPVTTHSCFYGVDTPTAEELIGNQMSLDEICAYLTADSLMYMTVAGLKECVGDHDNHCLACFDGRYPIPITEAKIKDLGAAHPNDATAVEAPVAIGAVGS